MAAKRKPAVKKPPQPMLIVSNDPPPSFATRPEQIFDRILAGVVVALFYLMLQHFRGQ